MPRRRTLRLPARTPPHVRIRGRHHVPEGFLNRADFERVVLQRWLDPRERVSCASLARDYGTTPRVIRWILRDHPREVRGWLVPTARGRRARQAEDNPAARLTWEDVFQIRVLRASGVPLKRLSEMYKVAVSHIHNIATNRMWRVPE